MEFLKGQLASLSGLANKSRLPSDCPGLPINIIPRRSGKTVSAALRPTNRQGEEVNILESLKKVLRGKRRLQLPNFKLPIRQASFSYWKLQPGPCGSSERKKDKTRPRPQNWNASKGHRQNRVRPGQNCPRHPSLPDAVATGGPDASTGSWTKICSEAPAWMERHQRHPTGCRLLQPLNCWQLTLSSLPPQAGAPHPPSSAHYRATPTRCFW